MKLKYLFMVATFTGIVCAFTSESVSETLAWGAVICLGISSALLSDRLGREIENRKGDEGR